MCLHNTKCKIFYKKTISIHKLFHHHNNNYLIRVELFMMINKLNKTFTFNKNLLFNLLMIKNLGNINWKKSIQGLKTCWNWRRSIIRNKAILMLKKLLLNGRGILGLVNRKWWVGKKYPICKELNNQMVLNNK